MKKVLVISHEATRTGAPIVLLNFLEALKKRNPELQIDLILAKGGALTDRFKNIGRTIQLDEYPNKLTLVRRLIRKIRSILAPASLASFDNPHLGKFVRNGYDVILSNTIGNGYILNAIKPKNCKVVSYIHELEPSVQRLTSAETLSYVFKYTNHFIVPSQAVMDNLVENHKVTQSSITLLSSYIPETEVDPISKGEIIRKLGLENNLVICGMGYLGWIKGSDLFIRICMLLKKLVPDLKFKFLWVGANKDSSEYLTFLDDAKYANVLDDIIVIENVNKPSDYLSITDVFLLTSREESFSLVIREAAMQKKPSICFNNIQGAVEFNQGYGGIITPYLNVNEMAHKLADLLRNKKEIERLGGKAWILYKELHSEEKSLPAFEAVLGV